MNSNIYVGSIFCTSCWSLIFYAAILSSVSRSEQILLYLFMISSIPESLGGRLFGGICSGMFWFCFFTIFGQSHFGARGFRVGIYSGIWLLWGIWYCDLWELRVLKWWSRGSYWIVFSCFLDLLLGKGNPATLSNGNIKLLRCLLIFSKHSMPSGVGSIIY